LLRMLVRVADLVSLCGLIREMLCLRLPH